MYVIGRTIPPNTSEKDAIEVELPVYRGIIHRIEIDFPLGCMALARTTLLRHRHQIFPSNGSSYFAGHGQTISFRDFYELQASPTSLVFRFWNLDETWSHTVTWRVGILNRRFVEIVPKWIDTLDKMAEVFKLPQETL